jgi:hypothetical protein
MFCRRHHLQGHQKEYLRPVFLSFEPLATTGYKAPKAPFFWRKVWRQGPPTPINLATKPSAVKHRYLL